MSEADVTGGFDWVADLPKYEGLLIPHTTSKIPRFSRFSLSHLFRSSSYSGLQDSLLDPLYALSSLDEPPPKEVSKALSSLAEYVDQVQRQRKTRSSSLKESQNLEEGIGKTLECYLIAVGVVCKATIGFDGQQEHLEETISQSMRGMFNIVAHYDHSSDPRMRGKVEQVQKNILSSPYSATHADNYLVPLFEQSQQLIINLKNAARGSYSTKSGSSPSEQATICEDEARWRIEWLRLYSEHLKGLAEIPNFAPTQEESIKLLKKNGKALKPKRKTKAEIKKEEEDLKNRLMRIVIEADILRCDLALTMGTAKIGKIKQRAKKNLPELSAERGSVDAESESGRQDRKSRKRRALTDESDFNQEEDIEDIKPVITTTPSRGNTVDENAADIGIKWETVAEDILIEVLMKAEELVNEHKASILTQKVDRSNWINDGAKPLKSSSSSTGTPVSRSFPQNRSNSKDVDELNGDDDSEEGLTSEESESEEEDMSYSCPLRSIFSLQDRYEEQRLAVWLSLASERRGKMSLFMRGSDGKVGSAWDALGLKLLLDHDWKTLDEFGLTGDKYNKWVELASRKNAKKIRRRGRKTV